MNNLTIDSRATPPVTRSRGKAGVKQKAALRSFSGQREQTKVADGTNTKNFLEDKFDQVLTPLTALTSQIYDLDVSSDDVDSVLSNIASALLEYAGKDRKRKIDNFPTWLEAFVILAPYRGYCHPDLYPKLVTYIGIINGLAGQMSSANLWLEYDQGFRMEMKHAGSTDLEWCREDSDLKAAVVRGNTRVVLPTSSVSRETKCYNCNQYGHIDLHCPAPSTRQTRTYDDRRRRESDRGSQHRGTARLPSDTGHRAGNASGSKDSEPRQLGSMKYPAQDFVTYFVDGLTNGFHIGYRGPEFPRETPNARTAFDYIHKHIRKYVAKEVTAKHTVGPFDEPPFAKTVVSSIGVRAKTNGGSRLIMDLSRLEEQSVNDFVNRADYSLTFTGVDDTIWVLSEYGPGTLMANANRKGALRLIPVHMDDWYYLF
ncbi:hypothetical protein RvY_01589 [Ramazzottius varieornatus]|uniref:CCHC-type domain-containing protein n=1 Tax=Ramazzottius varieornatus TaxID=947166 RepID=A0A1D1UNY4_RAMVA|nr:hypothetical protein RvY_01589 [Ramazzottius varieornatus]